MDVTIKMMVIRTEEMTKYHNDDYIKFLYFICPDNMAEYSKPMNRFNTGENCQVIDGMFEFCQVFEFCLVVLWQVLWPLLSSRETSLWTDMGACIIQRNLKHLESVTSVIIILTFLELLKYQQRVLYIDTDIHHGNGVEEDAYLYLLFSFLRLYSVVYIF